MSIRTRSALGKYSIVVVIVHVTMQFKTPLYGMDGSPSILYYSSNRKCFKKCTKLTWGLDAEGKSKWGMSGVRVLALYMVFGHVW